ncbi:MAG: protein adenylyltransferase SelO [Planctomycetaceae bacterium]
MTAHGAEAAAGDPGWRFDNAYARLPPLLFARVAPTPVRAPRLVWLNRRLAVELGLDPDALAAGAAEWFSGNRPPAGAEPIAQAYAGHQYGHFTNLGDGRAILLGEQVTPAGTRVDIQLKGAGRTPFSRSGDGRAALGPMLREAIVGEAMHALGIPTTRALAVVATGEPVYRERVLPGAVLARVAASHLRVGTFQFAAALGREDLLEVLLAHAVARHAPALVADPEPALAFLAWLLERQASLVARWMAVGFVHGVMNTDNMALSGETIDYGPCAFLDAYDPDTVFSSIDQHGRYAFARQPAIAHWNLARFAETLIPLIPGGEEAAIGRLEASLSPFPEHFERERLAGLARKLGLPDAEPGDAALARDLLAAMTAARADHTATFAALEPLAAGDGPPPAEHAAALAPVWLEAWRARLERQPGGRAAAGPRLAAANPAVIPRNHLVEEALAAAAGGDIGPCERLINAVSRPFAPRPEDAPFRLGPPPGSGCYRTFCGT